MKHQHRSAIRLALGLSLVMGQAFATVLDGHKVREIPDTKLSIFAPDELPEPEKLELDASDRELFPSGLNYFFPGESDGMFSMVTVLEASSSKLDDDFLKLFTESYLEARGEDSEVKYAVKLREAGKFGPYEAQSFTATMETSDIKMEEQGMVLVGEKEVVVYLVSAEISDSAAISEKKKAFDQLRYAGSAWAKGQDLKIK